MSVDGLLDSTIAICRSVQGNPDQLGDTPVPAYVVDAKAALTNAYSRAVPNDEGAGEMPRKLMLLIVLNRTPIVLGDTIYVRRGPMVGTWWTCTEQSSVRRAKHKEYTVRPFVGKTPNV